MTDFNWLDISLDDRWYDKTNPQPTLIDSDMLVMTGMAGAGNTRTGAYDPGASGNNVIRATLASSPVQVCGTGSQGHIGPQKIRPRVFLNGTGPAYMRLAYRVAGGPWSRTNWVQVLGAGAFYCQTIGTIRIPQTLQGSQSWEGRIEAYSSTPGDTLDVDYIEVKPAKRYAKVRGSIDANAAQVFSAQSGFNTEAGAITGDALAVGGSWTVVTNSDTDDFSAAAGVATRTAVSDSGTGAGLFVGRGVSAGTTNYTDIVVQLDYKGSVSGTSQVFALFARLVDSSNHLVLQANTSLSSPDKQFVYLYKYIGGSVTQLLPVPPAVNTIGGAFPVDTFFTLKLQVLANGTYFAWWGPAGGGALNLVGAGYDSALATGGTLATGKIGMVDKASTGTAMTRTYDNFGAWVPIANPVIASGGYVEHRHNATVRSSGAKLSPEGPYLKIDPSGRDGRAAQFVVSKRRNDIDVYPDDQIADTIRAEVDITPRVQLLDG